MTRYSIEWQMGGEVIIDTADSDWTPGEVEMQAGQAVLSASDAVADAVGDEFDDCNVHADPVDPTYKIRKLR